MALSFSMEPSSFSLDASAVWPKVAVIYLTYNTKDSAVEIPRCMTSLEKVRYPLDRWEIICVENPSSHGASWPFIQSDWVPKAGKTLPLITIEKNQADKGYAGANNVGLEIAKAHGCEYVFLLNQDTEVDPDFLRNAVARAEADPAVGLVQSFVLLGQTKDRVNSYGNAYHFLGYGFARGNHELLTRVEADIVRERVANPDLIVPTATGAALLVRLAMVEQTGLFDGRFYMYHEDMDLSFQARLQGWKVVIDPSSVVYHYYVFSKSIKKFYWMERNRFVFLLSYYKLATLLLILPMFVAVELGSFLLAIRGGWWREKARAWGFFFFPSTWAWVSQRRRTIQVLRRMSDRDLLKYAGASILFQDGGEDEARIREDINGGLVTRIANPLMNLYWKIVYGLIRW
jgi:GT2 family glycosyltransferase